MPQETKIIYVINTEVLKISEEFARMYTSGFGESATFNKVSKGWFASFAGSYEALHLGYKEPEWKVGDKIRITFEKVNDDLPNQPPV